MKLCMQSLLIFALSLKNLIKPVMHILMYDKTYGIRRYQRGFIHNDR